MFDNRNVLRARVIIIGNGPVGLMASYCLAGNWPYWNGKTHPITPLDFHLRENQDLSLFQQSPSRLSELGDFVGGRCPSPIGNLYDYLSRCHESHYTDFLEWRHNETEAIDHVVLGSDGPGGSWNRMNDRSVKSISTFYDVELPGMDRMWKCDCVDLSRFSTFRPTINCIRKHYWDYPSEMGLTQYQRPPFTVNCIKQVPINGETTDDGEIQGEWEVSGFYHGETTQVTFRGEYLILAIGRCHNKRQLDITSDDTCPIISSYGQLKESPRLPLLVVGAGLEAADQILKCRASGVSVIHVYRKKSSEVFQSYSLLDSSIYPEYTFAKNIIASVQVEDQMWSYRGIECSIIESIIGETVSVRKIDGSEFISLACSAVISAIGYDTSDIITKCGLNDLTVDSTTYESALHRKMFILGSLAGDKFVRFAKGGVVAAVGRIINYQKNLNFVNKIRN